MRQEINKIIYVYREDHILHTACKPGSELNLEDGIECTKISLEMIDHQPVPLLCDLSNVIDMTQECRKHFAGPVHAKSFTKCALIVSSPISRIIGNFFLGLNKPLKPTRLFKSPNEGLKWLKKNDDIKAG